MKLCFVIYSLGNGGAERVLTTLANYFSEKNEVCIATFNEEAPFYPLHEKISILSIQSAAHSNNTLIALKNNAKSVRKLTKVLQKEDPDVVISFMTTCNIIATLAAKAVGKPIVISERIHYDFLTSKIWRGLRRVIYPLADHLVVQSQYDMQKYHFVKNRSVILNPLFFKQTVRNTREHIILAVGRLDQQKGFDMLIEAYSRLQTDWKLWIVGEGAERKNLEKLITEKSLQGCVLLPGRTDKILEHYRKASIFVLSSRTEGFPNALAEAMACGCAVTAFDCKTGPSDMIENGVNGLLVKNGDIDALAESLQRLIDNAHLRDKLSTEAVKIGRKLHLQTIGDQWLNLIQSLKKI